MDHDTFRPAIRTIAITGGGSGIGRAVARQFASQGFEVAILGRHGDALRETAGGEARLHSFQLDVTNAEACVEVFAAIKRQLGPVDVLIANAAVYPKIHFLDQSADSFSQTMRTNVEGIANSIRLVLPDMLSRNLGRIIVMGSLANMHPIPMSAAYSASKGALHALVKAIASEIDRSRYPNVLINELSPGETRTSMSDYGRAPEDVFADVKRLIDLKEEGPTGRFFQQDKEIRLDESWKRALLRTILFRK